VTASNGYFTVQDTPPGPSTGDDAPPMATDFMDWTTANMPYMRFVNQALLYLAESPLALEVMWAAKNAGVHLAIVTGDIEWGYRAATNTVFWNPGMAVRFLDGAVMSPAMVLIHELAHAINFIANPTPDPQYGNSEDRRVIVNYENLIAAQLGEPTRNNHVGTPLYVPTVTYHRPAPAPSG